LRFLLQEFDLPRGPTIIGRSLDCHVTIEDPLVSRQHARVVIDDEGAIIEDLGSRNGVKLNGVALRESSRLKDGDRLRIGTQDFVFCSVEPVGASHAKTTGVLRLCAHCRLPYAREMVACPNCEATEQTDEETLSGTFGPDKHHSWSVQLLVEALEKALSLGRTGDAERIVRRASAQVEELIVSGTSFDPKQLAALCVAAVQTSLASNDPTWGISVLGVYKLVGQPPPLQVVDALVELAGKFPGHLRSPIAELSASLRTVSRSASQSEVESLARLEQLRQLLEGESKPELDTTGDRPGAPPRPS
jgi:hypothetical protein